MLARRYYLLEELGRGGVGVVWRARDERLGREVAIKVLHPWIAQDPEPRARFRREATALASLTHPNIVRLYDYEEAEEAAFLVMELVDGSNLEEDGRITRPLSWARTRGIIAPVAEALAYAHGRGLVHRDLKPQNVLMDPSNRPMVSDFGLAQLAEGTQSLTATGVLLGTPEYWSPEQAEGGAVGPPSDVYSLGCVAFFLTTGHLPFEGNNRLAVGYRRVEEDPPDPRCLNPKLGANESSLILGLLERDPSKRPTARALLASLRRANEHPTRAQRRQSQAQPVLDPTRVRTEVIGREATTVAASPRRRGRRVMLGLVALALAGSAAVLGLTRPWNDGSAGARSTNPSENGATADAPPPSRFTTPALIGSGLVRARRLIVEQARRDDVDAPDLRVVARRYSESTGEGVILSQAPRPGRRIPPDAEVRVVTSKGTAFAAVPAITNGDTLLIARRRLAQADFQSNFRYAPNWDVARGHIVSLTPAAGTRVRRPGSVRLTVSSGPPMARVPRLVGGSLEDAQDALRQTGLRWTTTTRNSTKPDGTVLDQSPAADEQVIVNSTVTLVVSHQPRWSTIYRFSGDIRPAQSPRLALGAKWRIRWTLVGLTASAVVSWRAPDGFTDFEEIDTFSGRGVIAPDVLGTFSIRIEPEIILDGDVRWSLVIETFG